MADIIQINDTTWRIEDNGVRFFLLTGTEKALLIDSGMNTPNAKQIAESITKLPVMLYKFPYAGFLCDIPLGKK